MKEITITADMVLKKLNCLNVPTVSTPESPKTLNMKL